MLDLNCLMIGSEDVIKLAAYYEAVLEKKPDMEDHGFVGFMAGSAFLNIGPHDKVAGKNQNPERMIFFFASNDVKADFERIAAIDGTTVVQEPYSPGGDESMQLATLADPDGNYFQLSTPWNG